MKFDMCGAATVFGVMLALSLAKPPVNVVGVIPTVENMPDGKAVKTRRHRDFTVRQNH